MKIKSHLLVCENTNKKNEDPHAIGIIEVPWDQVEQHDSLKKLRNEMPRSERILCERQGILPLSIDYGFEEDFEGSGVGLVMRNLNVDVGKLSDPDKGRIRQWLQEQYGVTTQSDAELHDALHQPPIKDHITADMTVAGMSKAAFMEALAAHEMGKELPYPLQPEDMEKIAASLEARGKTDPEAYYARTAMAMREQWPSPKTKNYGHQDETTRNPIPGEANVIFFKGFESSAEVIIKSGSYTRTPAWPDTNNGFDCYDENGIGRNEDGDIVPAAEIPASVHYSYYPHMAFTTELEGPDAMAAIDRLLETAETSPDYDGYRSNCVSVAGNVVFGEKYKDLIHKVAGVESQDLEHAKVTNAMLRQGTLFGTTPPEGMAVTPIIPDKEPLLTYDAGFDTQRIGQALRQIAELPGREPQSQSFAQALEPHNLSLARHVDKLPSQRSSPSQTR